MWPTDMGPGYHRLPPPAPQHISTAATTTSVSTATAAAAKPTATTTPVITTTTAVATPVALTTNVSIVAKEFHYFTQYVAHLAEKTHPNIMRWMFQLSSLLSNIIETVMDKPHDVDTIDLLSGVIFIHIFYISHRLGYDTSEHIPKQRFPFAKLSKQEQCRDLTKANKTLTAIFSVLMSRQWTDPHKGKMKDCLLKTGQIVLNMTSFTNIHELLEQAIERKHIGDILNERNDQATKNQNIALELENHTFHPIIYRMGKCEQCKTGNGKLQSLLNTSGVTGFQLTLKEVATKVHFYLLDLIYKGHKLESILATLGDVLSINCCKWNLQDRRMLLHPLTQKMTPLSYVNLWNRKYPKRTHLFCLPAISGKQRVTDPLEKLNKNGQQEEEIRNLHPLAIDD